MYIWLATCKICYFSIRTIDLLETLYGPTVVGQYLGLWVWTVFSSFSFFFFFFFWLGFFLLSIELSVVNCDSFSQFPTSVGDACNRLAGTTNLSGTSTPGRPRRYYDKRYIPVLSDVFLYGRLTQLGVHATDHIHKSLSPHSGTADSKSITLHTIIVLSCSSG